MSNIFDQTALRLLDKESHHRIKVSKLMKLVENHPYRSNIERTFNIKEIANEIICIDFVDVVYKRIDYLLKNFRRFNIKALVKNISLHEHDIIVEGIDGVPLKFIFDEFKDDNNSVLNDLEAYSIYDSKNAFLSQYNMTKYANHLYKNEQYELLRYNVEYFKSQAIYSKVKAIPRSYRLLEYDGNVFLRGVTSVNQYNEYGVDFAFVVAMLLFHGQMKERPGDNFAISSASISASKMEFFVVDKTYKTAKSFGKIGSSTKVTTNDLGNASFKFLNTVKVGIEDSAGFYIFPVSKSDYKNELKVTHNTTVENAMQLIMTTKSILRSSDDFVEDLEAIKGINTPDELRSRILFKLESKNSTSLELKAIKDLFKPRITNNIENFSKLLDMCRKAEELNIDYDLKDKIRYIISDIILNKK